MPYGSVKGERSSLVGINITGLKRRGFKRSDIDILRDIYHAIFCNMTQNFVERINHVEAKYGHHPHTKKFFAFIKHATQTEVYVCRKTPIKISVNHWYDMSFRSCCR